MKINDNLFTSLGLGRVISILTNKAYKIDIPSKLVRLLAGEVYLVIHSPRGIWAKDILIINGFEIQVLLSSPTNEFDQFNWKVKFDCEQMTEFRESLTFKVA